MEIFSSLPEIRNLMCFKGKTNFSIITVSPDLEEEGKRFSYIFDTLNTFIAKVEKINGCSLGFLEFQTLIRDSNYFGSLSLFP